MNEPIGVRVFCATKPRDREALGETITAWLREHPQHQIVGTRILQTSDTSRHCLTIVFVYRVPPAANCL